MATAKDDPAATGKVTAYEAGKTISVQVGDDSKSYKIDGERKVEGELAVGKDVQVWVKDGVPTKIVVKERENTGFPETRTTGWSDPAGRSFVNELAARRIEEWG
jgi:hypothetical protein